MSSTLSDLSNELAGIVAAVEPHIVSVRARRHYPSSGIRWKQDVVVTADHAVQREEEISLALGNGKVVGAALAGRDPGTDLAVLKLEAPGSAPAPLSRAERVRVGELVLVVGRSPDSGVNASLGIVSANSGPWRTWRGGQIGAYIRLDAKLFPQSSGGAVVNTRGEIIGVATSALSRIAGLAIPVSTVENVTEKLLQRGFVPRAYVGVGVQQVPFPKGLREKLGLSNHSGLIVLNVEPNGPADAAGILVGDILTGIGDTGVERAEDLQESLDSLAIGTSVTIRYVRGGAVKQSALTIGERPGRRS